MRLMIPLFFGSLVFSSFYTPKPKRNATVERLNHLILMDRLYGRMP